MLCAVWSYGEMAITPDFESGIPSSNLGETFLATILIKPFLL